MTTDIRDMITRYLDRYPAEADELALLVEALESGADLASRSTFPLHVTCSAAAIRENGKVLMIRHRGLGRWLLPGGHIEPGDASVYGAALRELEEEAGICWQHALAPPAMDVVPVDIDVHEIPAAPAKGEPAHWHADFRFAVWTGSAEVELQVEEVTAFDWRDPGDLHTPRLIAKVAAYV
jgi:8-oxo-dGTP pyrophosphatase MutT (NUDIX family)